MEQRDRNDRQIYPNMPSPLGRDWFLYISHRLKILEAGIDCYTTDKYTRLKFEKYTESNRVCDSIAGMLTGHQPTLIHLGAAQMPSNSPIGIKKGLRCPGNRKMLRSYKKCRGCFVNMVDEYYSSQTCGKCYSRFDRRTKPNRYKICLDCKPYPNEMIIPLPSIIVGLQSKRMRSLMNFLTENEAEQSDEHQLDGEANPHPIQPNTTRLLPKVVIYKKNWLVNSNGVLEYGNAELPNDDAAMECEARQHKTIWHRDIVAARCIMIKGMPYIAYKAIVLHFYRFFSFFLFNFSGHCDLFGIELPQTLQRPSGSNQQAPANN